MRKPDDADMMHARRPAGPRFCEDAGVPRWLLAIGLVGCGHVGFDPVADQDAGASNGVPPAPGWALVQTAGSGNATVTLKPVGAGHLLVVAMEIDTGGAPPAVTDGCNSYVAIPTATSTSSLLQVELQVFYAYATQPCQVNTIHVASNRDVCALVAWEVSGITGSDPVDAVAVLSDQPRSNAPLAPKITTSAAGEFVMASAIVLDTVSGIHPGNEFTNDQVSDGDGWAHLTDPMAPAGVHQAQWDATPGSYCASAVAFKVGP